MLLKNTSRICRHICFGKLLNTYIDQTSFQSMSNFHTHIAIVKFVYNDQVMNIVSFISIGFNISNCIYGNTISVDEIKFLGMVSFKSGRHLRLRTSVGKYLRKAHAVIFSKTLYGNLCN